MTRPKDLTRRPKLLESCFDCMCEYGLEAASTLKMAATANMSVGNLFFYFDSKDEIIREATALCMAKVEDDFMAQAPKDLADLDRFLNEMPYITAREHGAKYRCMYQVYSSPQYREEGIKFFEGVKKRYRSYAEELAPKLEIPVDLLQGFIYIFVRACVHYALFEDEDYLNLQMNALRTSLTAVTGQDFSSSKSSSKVGKAAKTSAAGKAGKVKAKTK